MELSLEVYRNILNNVRSRADIASLCKVSKGFRYVAERALYNTIFVRDPQTTIALCETLFREARIALMVEALTISLSLPSSGILAGGNDNEGDVRGDGDGSDSGGQYEGKDGEEEEEEQEEEEQEEEDGSDELAVALAMSLGGSLEGSVQVEIPGPSRVDMSITGVDGTPADPNPLPAEYWTSISNAFQRTHTLRHLNILIDGPFNTSNTWIFKGCTFSLQSFHCDLDWNQDLVSFFRTQVHLRDLYIIDYNPAPTDTTDDDRAAETNPLVDTTSDIDTSRPGHLDTYPPNPYPRPQPGPPILPNLSKLECTFSEAAMSLVQGRPITHLKTCFSKTDMEEKKAELDLLFSKIRLSTRRLHSLDIADSAYEETFSMKLVRTVVATSRTSAELRYLGTVVLPIAGRERLTFYGLLMRLPRIACVEFEVSDWDPSPLSVGLPAFKALANELRLYCPTITRVIFVHEFERTVISYVEGVGRMDCKCSPEILWRDF
ncbi:hypothetical protein E1B28_012937 [Marasmius oreades]|uniref:F-box domain-containing protein n=1 Tax=Marasmius oreades TaxID=181124 RepID=A0A9P7RSJ0_9AGAR|nr:uncharacterized protein E1B28_012937 [Marasmius oreades]KAG7088991.1 hypothetical protein E1B28_012937 [Marasmius oreades]